ncbi:MAG TPA: hypothetical protein VD994_02705, partial [Prosthecobacter sp.]|nr:hypothetical protein [Prosthecobacter sp.]
LALALQPHVQRVHADISDGTETAALCYRRGFEGGSLSQRLLALRDEEQRTRQTAEGPHRDDVGLTLNELEATAFASEGQQRSLALSLKIGQALVLEQSSGQPPLMMLDDIFGELDPSRRRALIRLLPPGTQKLVTTTGLDWLREEGMAGQIYAVEQAKLIPETGALESF